MRWLIQAKAIREDRNYVSIIIIGTKLSKPTPIATKTPTATQSPTIKSTKQAIVAPKAEKHISSTQLVADIRKNLGCGSVDEKYTVQVVAMAIAQTNPKTTEKLTQQQFYQAVRQTIAENQS